MNTTNPNCFTYTTDELLIELLGGVRVDTFDRMRVTMKVTVVNRKHAQHLNNEELAGLSVRHNLDLYNDTQVEKFVRRVAEVQHSRFFSLKTFEYLDNGKRDKVGGRSKKKKLY
jgi:hypothetical protein